MCNDYRGGVCYTPDMETAAAQQEQQLADAQAAAEKAAADAAAQAAADAAAKAAAQRTAQQTSYAPGQAPAGTPIPLHLDTDPNSGSYNQMVIEPPDQFCASDSGTTGAGGVQVCA
jgi:hypothetical protein